MNNGPERFKWGIIGCGMIAPRFFQSVERTGEGEVVAAASKSLRRAKRFQKKCGVSRVFDSYVAMLEKEELDAVYIATTHNAHAEVARLCLEHDIPVLIEKAFTQNANQAAQVISLARQKNLFAMEAMWTRFNPATIKLRELMDEGLIGEPQEFKASFCVRMNPLGPKMMPWNRMYSPKLAGGALLDLGIYPISFARMIFGEPPSTISSMAELAWTGVDKASQYSFEYPNDAKAEIETSFVKGASRDAIVTGTLGRVLIPAFYRADRLIVQREDLSDEVIQCDEPSFEYQIREAHRCLREGLTESPILPLNESLETMKTLDEIRAQWGMKYPDE